MGIKLQLPEEVTALAFAIDLARKNKGYTLQQLGELSGIDKGQISRFAAGRFKTISKNLQQICNILELDPNDYRVVGSRIPSHVLTEIERGWHSSGTQRRKFEDALVALSKMFS